MPQLQFKRTHVDAILRGRKIQTMRARLGGGFVAGSKLRLCNGYGGDSHIGDAIVESVARRLVSDLTDVDARLDGFGDASALRLALEETYPGCLEVFVVRWRGFQPNASSSSACLRSIGAPENS